MIHEHDQLIRRIVIVIDCLVVGIAFCLPYVLEDHLSYFYPVVLAVQHGLHPLKECAWVLFIVVPLWIASLSYSGMYRSMREREFIDICWNIVEGSILAVTAFSIIVFFFKFEIISRTFITVFFLCVLIMLVVEKSLIFFLLQHIRRRGSNTRTLLIAGSGKRAKNFAHVVEAHPQWGYKILGFVDEKERVGMKVGKYEVIGSLKDLAGILDKNVISEVVFILPRKWLPILEDYIGICEKVGVKATVAMDLFNTSIAKPIIKDLNLAQNFGTFLCNR